MASALGKKFLFPYATTDKNLHQVLAELENCIDNTIPATYQTEAFLETAHILRSRLNFQENDTIQWLCFIALRTKRFFEQNKHIFINFVTTKKTVTPNMERTNTILTSKCVCGKKYKITSTKFNETGETAAARRIITNHTGCTNVRHAFRKVQVKKGLYYKSQTGYLLKYHIWKHRGKVINTESGMPNYHFAKLIK